MTKKKSGQKKKVAKQAMIFNPGDRVKINTGSRYIVSVDDYFGTVVGPSQRFSHCLLVDTPDGCLDIGKGRLTKA